jgi:arylsulfatase A-like enzyme
VEIVAEFQDSTDEHAPDESELARVIREGNRAARRHCAPTERVFGEMRALLRDPMKLVSYAHYPAALYDLGADPGEEHDLATARPELVAELTSVLARRIAERQPPDPGAPGGTLPPAVAERLRALGYLGGDAGAARTAPTPGRSPAHPG